MVRFVILISGRGSNMQSLAEHIAAKYGESGAAEIALVLADRSAAGLAIADGLNIKTCLLDPKQYPTKAEHEAAMIKAIDQAKPDAVLLAGYMSLLSAEFCGHYQGRLYNIHPSLLPKYKGLDTHARAIAAGDSFHGCTIHHVTAELDSGEIMMQRRIAIKQGDTPKTLAARLLIEEHAAYCEFIDKIIASQLETKTKISNIND